MATPDPRTVEAVQDILEYHFSDSSILHNALQITHPILSNETLPDEPDSRLAYLGDRVVHLAIADHWHRTPLSIGLVGFQAQNISSDTNLCGRALLLGLDKHVIYDHSDAMVESVVLADAMKALLGAVFVDSAKDLSKVEEVMQKLGLLPQTACLEQALRASGASSMLPNANDLPVDVRGHVLQSA